MSANQVDVVVVGMGPGGEAAASALANAGLDVVAIESRLVGGECPYFACIPTKMMLRAADSLAEARRVPELGGTAQVSPDLSRVARRIREEGTTDWDDQIAVDRYLKSGGQFVRGRATVTGPRTVKVSGHEFEARRAIVLNTGTDPAVPELPGLSSTPYWTNREAVAAEQAPASLIVLGGGPVGTEFAQIFARFGTTVDLVQSRDRLLPRDEPEAGQSIAAALSDDGVQLHLGTRAESVSHDGAQFTVKAGGQELHADKLLVATGRQSDFTGLGLDTAGIDTTGRYLTTDANGRVADGIYAIGDITGHGAYTHMSMYESDIVVAHILGEEHVPADYRAVPHVTFTDPEAGGVGLTEAQAREQGIDVVTGLADITSSSRGWIHNAGTKGVVKLVADGHTGTLIGGASVGPAGGEVLSMLTLAIQERIPVEHLRQMIYPFPSFHAAVKDALSDMGPLG